jgi:hypothetical protein
MGDMIFILWQISQEDEEMEDGEEENCSGKEEEEEGEGEVEIGDPSFEYQPQDSSDIVAAQHMSRWD